MSMDSMLSFSWFSNLLRTGALFRPISEYLTKRMDTARPLHMLGG